VDPRTVGKTYTAPDGKTFRPSLFVTLTCPSYGRGTPEGTPVDPGPLRLHRGALRLVPPKTEDSAPTVPLPPVCVVTLRAHQQQQAAERAEGWPDWEDHGFVFPSRRGTPMEPITCAGAGARYALPSAWAPPGFMISGIPVTLLLDLGAPPHVVREIVGHSDIEVTMTIYAHVSLEEKRKALGKLGEVLG